ncbi:transcriptional regulator with XRE-family HTH domain [Aquamicrobium lusatiense]|uniref:Transcriptional regulator with XRE-family HTH domain n=1 Tax=Aquamicrobium lusatiense TaxID=89772 RepID=A0A7W9RZ44_9HYPH|nr:helix-turn-helix domain-containing protein [Aquamicrobium lusatiense]MBB6011171.1 transcriptional regulator with XRE-family HTH domain [Aquamicrobium lusatiense]
MQIFPEQCRAARGLLNWTQDRLASAAGVSRSTIKDFECHRHALQRGSEELVIRAFTRCGVELLFDTDGAGIGVRMEKAGNLPVAARS